MKGKPKILKNTTYWAATLIIMAALITGCGGATPTLEPTRDLQPTLDLVRTEAALTLVAELTQNAPTATPVVVTDTPAATATSEPTNTPEATATAAVILPIATATAIPTNTPAAVTLTPVATATATDLNCTIKSQSVSFGDDFPPNADFDGRWVVENTGTQTWSSSAVDFKYISGTEFHTRVSILDLPVDVPPDGEITLIIDMQAPANPGRYTTTWAIVQGSTTICTMPITLDVVQ